MSITAVVGSACSVDASVQTSRVAAAKVQQRQDGHRQIGFSDGRWTILSPRASTLVTHVKSLTACESYLLRISAAISKCTNGRYVL